MPPKMIGSGVYTLSEVTRFTGAPARTVRDWFKWRSDKKGRGPIFISDYEPAGDDYAVSFLNLIDVYVASFFLNNEVGPKVIRRAYTILQQQLHTPHPFAHADLSTDGERIIRESVQRDRGDKFVDVISKQLLFPEFRARLTRINYNVATRLADRWRIADGVIVNPAVGFGKPVLENTGISTAIVANQYRANKGDATLVARLYKITEMGVRSAVQFEDSIRRAA